jgi:hypothetical protein
MLGCVALPFHAILRSSLAALMPLEFRAVTGEGSEVRMALHLTSLHKEPLILLVGIPSGPDGNLC